jgi:MFS family permease
MVQMIFASRLLYFYVSAIVFGVSSSGADTALTRLVGDFFGRRSIGALMGLLGLGWRIGASSGALVGGIIYDVTGKYETSFATAALCATIGIFLVFLIYHFRPELSTGTSLTQDKTIQEGNEWLHRPGSSLKK